MLKLKDIIEINIESLAYGGEGVAKHEGQAIFVSDVVPEDVIKAEITFIKKNYAKAKLVEVVKPSQYRVKPFCGLANTCGGCQWQHIDYNYQLQAKKQVVQDCLKNIAKVEVPVLDVLHCEKTQEYRCKVQYPVSQTKVSKRFLAGYYKKGTHDIINIKRCPIQPAIIDEITQYLRDKAQELALTAYNERNGKGLIRHFVFRYSSSNKDINLIAVINCKKVPARISELLNSAINKFTELKGVLVNLNTSKSNVIMGRETILVSGEDFITENLEDKVYKVSAGSFFQVNPETAVKMFNTVKKMISDTIESPTVLDVYAGVGSFAIWLKDIAKHITTIEEYPRAIEDAKANIELNNADNITIVEGKADKILTGLVETNNKYDVIILDPPRKGCDEEAIDAVSKLTDKTIIYVSCNPSTLARDVKKLAEFGFTPEYVQPVDMFCHSYHVESIVLLKKS